MGDALTTSPRRSSQLLTLRLPSNNVQVLADIHEECNKFGTVLRVLVPRPPVPAQVRTGAALRMMR